MAIQKIIQVEAVPELPAYHGLMLDSEQTPFVLGISPAAVALSNPPDLKTDNGDAKTYIESFLSTAWAEDSWAVYDLQIQNGAIIKATKIESASLVHGPDTDINLQEKLKTWLEKREEILEPTQSFYAAVRQPGEEVEAGQATVGDILRSTMNWDAPIPQKIGLSKLIRAKLPVPVPCLPEDPDNPCAVYPRRIVLPFAQSSDVPDEIAGEDILPIDGDLLSKDWNIELRVRIKNQDFLGTGKEIDCLTNTLRRFPDKNMRGKDIDIFGVNKDTGFMKNRESTDEYYRLLKFVEANAATQCWATPALLDCVTQNEAIKASFAAKPGALCWLAVAGTVSILDPLLLALSMPEQGDTANFKYKSEGSLLAPLIARLLTALNAYNKVRNTTARLEISDQQIRTALIQSAWELSLLQTGATTDSAIAQAKLFLGLNGNGKEHDELIKRLDAFAKGDNPPAISKGILNSILSSLESLVSAMHSEGGVEAILKRVINGDANQIGLKDRFLKKFENAQGEVNPGILKMTNDGFESYSSFVDGDFDAHNALRKTVGFLTFERVAGQGRGGNVNILGSLSVIAQEFGGNKLSDDPGMDVFKARLFHDHASGNPLDKLYARLWHPNTTGWLSDDEKETIEKELTERSQAVSKEWLRIASPAQEPYQLMVPDSSPAPLPMQIGDDADSAEAELFEELFSGVGVLIRRDDQQTWCHANLVKLVHNPHDPGVECSDKYPCLGIESVACRALQPSRMDGRLTLFMPYDGFPLSTPAFDQTQLEQEEPSYEDKVLRKPFYETEDVENAEEWAKVPQLAYGRAFDLLAYLRTEGGVLPKAVRDSSYWLPGKPGVHAPLPKDVDVERFIYRRRTAIGKLGVEESSEYTASRELHKDITFYSEDFPRQSLVAESDNPAVLDLIRNADGTGGLMLSKKKPAIHLRLDEVCAWGASTLQVDVFHLDKHKGGGLERVADKGWPYRKVDGKEVHATVKFAGGEELLPVEISVSSKSLAINGDEFEFESELGEETQVWIRLTLTADGDRAALSFGDTNKEDGFKHFYAKPQPATKVLLRPKDDATKWLDGFKDETTLNLKYPRVGYLDLERWCANSDLVKKHGSPFQDGGGIPDGLLDAYLLRGLDTVETDENGQRIKSISRLLEELPDPAVHNVLIRLAPDSSMGTGTSTDISNTLHYVLEIPKVNWPDENLDDIKSYRDSLKDIDNALQAPVTVMTKDKASLSLAYEEKSKSVVATVPEGMIARLSFEIMVDSECFVEGGAKYPYAPIDPGIGAHAYAHYNFRGEKYHLFRGEEFVIEVMTNSLPLRVDCNGLDDDVCEAKRKKEKPKEKAIRDLALEHVVADTSGRDRAYSLRQTTLPIDAATPTKPQRQNVRLWRNLSKLTIYTQQWRYMGRPIYNLPSKLTPKYKGAFNTDPSDPVVELDIGVELVSQMEHEAYFGRPDHDAIFINRKIQPLPVRDKSVQTEGEDSTVLERFSWEPDSATLFRHRFEYWSRYAAAMSLGEIKSVRSWDEDFETESDTHPECEQSDQTDAIADISILKSTSGAATGNNWAMRLAVKALIRDTELTRPQVKALIPLTYSATSPTETPPILCVLQEAPYQSGGLAERLLGGIAAGIHYGLEPNADKPEEKILRVCDVRKEIGPNPRLSLDRLDEGKALGATINNEGPIGLTFDRSSTSTPAWSNSEIIFSPLLTSGKPLESEHRLGVTVRRILDPGWCYSPSGREGSVKNSNTKNTYSASRTWYVEFTPPKKQRLQPTLSIELGKNDNLDVIKFDDKLDGFIDVTMNDLCLDETSGNGEFKKICRIARAELQKIILLHQAVGNKRYRVSVLADTHKATSEEAIGKGQSNFPKVLVSMEWTVPESQFSSLTNTPMLLVGGASAVRPSGASAPTDIYWVETRRNSDSIYVHHAENPDIEAPIQTRLGNVSPDSVRSEITADGWLIFKKGETGCYVKSKALPNYMPVSEHRHLAAWLFKQSQTIGQPVEEYVGGLMLYGDSANIPKDMVERIRAKDDVSVRLFEFQTPAQPIYLGASDTATDDELLGQGVDERASTYKAAFFDIYGTMNVHSGDGGKVDPPNKMDCRLRIVRGDKPAVERSIYRLELIMKSSTDVNADEPMPIDIKLVKEDSPENIDYFLISLKKEEENGFKYQCEVRAVYLDGKNKIILENDLVTFPDQFGEGLFIRANAYNNIDENIPGTWGDISLLSSKDADREFDFDWIIPALDDVERKKAVTTDKLNKLKECQAGYVTLTNPIVCHINSE